MLKGIKYLVVSDDGENVAISFNIVRMASRLFFHGRISVCFLIINMYLHVKM